MDSSERVNLPAWKGQKGHYEIWFVVALDLDARRATWVRYTTFSPHGDGEPHCSVYAADFDADRDPRRAPGAAPRQGDADAPVRPPPARGAVLDLVAGARARPGDARGDLRPDEARRARGDRVAADDVDVAAPRRRDRRSHPAPR